MLRPDVMVYRKSIDHYLVATVAPHIGHLYSALLADVFHRWHKLKFPHDLTIFSTGTDEHGLKIQQAARKFQRDPCDFCSDNSLLFRTLFEAAGITATDFIRTTQPRHHRCVQHAWESLMSKGLIKKGNYAGWYSTSDEAFVPESQLTKVDLKNGEQSYVSTETGHPVEWMEEENYVFPLSHFQDDLKTWISKKPIFPTLFNDQVEHWLNERVLPELSVSRSSDRMKWGIDVPGDTQQKVYVWMDALLNYLTVAGYPDEGRMNAWWPVDLQIIGKDILKFHAIYWPAFLMGLGLKPPKRLLCHSHWTVDHQKISKSLGNVVDPFESIKRFTVDGLRYFLLREGVPHSDSNYSEDKLISYLNTELANTLGNLLNRCTSSSVNIGQMFPCRPEKTSLHTTLGDPGIHLQEQLDGLYEQVDKQYENGNIYKGIDAIFAVLRDTNLLVQENTPWTLAKGSLENDLVKLEHVLYLALECLRRSAILLLPVTPNLSQLILNKLNCHEDLLVSMKVPVKKLLDVNSERSEPRKLSNEKVILFNKIPLAKISDKMARQ